MIEVNHLVMWLAASTFTAVGLFSLLIASL